MPGTGRRGSGPFQAELTTVTRYATIMRADGAIRIDPQIFACITGIVQGGDAIKDVTESFMPGGILGRSRSDRLTEVRRTRVKSGK